MLVVLINKIIFMTILIIMINKSKKINLIKMHINSVINSLKISKILKMIFKTANIIKNLFNNKF
jgi:hypothetical protein